MPRYLIPWRMSGVVELWAGSHDEAQAAFDELDVSEIAQTNESLDQDPPKAAEEVLEEMRKRALDRIFREASLGDKNHG